MRQSAAYSLGRNPRTFSVAMKRMNNERLIIISFATWALFLAISLVIKQRWMKKCFVRNLHGNRPTACQRSLRTGQRRWNKSQRLTPWRCIHYIWCTWLTTPSSGVLALRRRTYQLSCLQKFNLLNHIMRLFWLQQTVIWPGKSKEGFGGGAVAHFKQLSGTRFAIEGRERGKVAEIRTGYVPSVGAHLRTGVWHTPLPVSFQISASHRTEKRSHL